jgi:rhomboid protease GluP
VSTLEPAPTPRVRLSLPLTRPVLAWGLLGLNILVFAVETLVGGSENSATLIELGAKVNVLIAMGEYWRLVTPMFLHIGVMHILVNSYAIYAIGPEVEALFGRSRFFAIYLLSGVAGNVMSYAFTPNLSAGASTAIFGLVGAEMVFFYRQRKTLGAFGQRRLINILLIIALNLFIGSSGGVDNFGHAGGFLGGILLAWLLCPEYAVEYGLDGQPRVRDHNSLWRELPGVVLFGVLLIAATAAVTLQTIPRS